MTDQIARTVAPSLRTQLGTDGNWESAGLDPSSTLDLLIHVESGTAATVTTDATDLSVSVQSRYGETIHAQARADQVPDLAAVPSIRTIKQRSDPRPHSTSQGVGTTNADDLQNQGITGSGTTVAVIDLQFNPDQSEIKDQVIDQVGPSNAFQSGTSELHGTACAEIVAEICPNADLVLVSAFGSFFPDLIDTITTNHDPDVMTMSLGYSPSLRIDGRDYLSQRIAEYTSNGGLFCVSAGNEADGGHYDRAYVDGGNGYMDFGGSEFFRIEVNSANQPLYVHSDADWSTDASYAVELYDENKSLVETFGPTTTPRTEVVVQSAGTHYLKIKDQGLSGDEHFDVFPWGNVSLSTSTPQRSLGIPATSPDSETLSTGAVYWGDDSLESFSSRGPTQDGRQGVDVVAPDGTSSDTYGRAFFGTSAACPHTAGVAALLVAGTDASNTEIRSAMTRAARDISDSDVAAAPNGDVGAGYVDAKAAYDLLGEPKPQSPTATKWTSNSIVDPQYNRPAVDSGQVYVGGLQNAFYALSRSDGTSIGWSLDRGNKAGLSDSSAYLWTAPSQPKLIFGSGQGRLYNVDADDATEFWSGQEIPDLGSAITASPTVDNGTVYVGTDDGRVLGWDGETADRLWETTVDGPVFSTLAADDGLVYVTTESGTLQVLDGANGKVQWTANVGVHAQSSPALGNGRVYVAGEELFAYDAGDTKSRVWQSNGFGGTDGSNPTYFDGSLYVGSTDGNLYAYSAVDGSERWTYSTNGPIASTPVVGASGNYVAVVSTDGTMYHVSTAGDLVDTVSIPSETLATPAVANGEIFLPAADGVVYALE